MYQQQQPPPQRTRRAHGLATPASALRSSAVMYVIKLLRRVSDKEPPLTMWLSSEVPLRWGSIDAAMRFDSKGAAWRAAGRIRTNGTWSVEETRD
jgi:hypothetical protein